jgi:hypothetical protein
MKIYLVISSFPYEGSSYPEFAYFSKEKAEAKAKELQDIEDAEFGAELDIYAGVCGTSWDVHEMETED